MNRSLTSLTEEPSSSFSSRDAEDSSIQRSYLSCGAKLVTRSIKNHPNFNFFIRVIGAGSGAETLGNFKRGLSHMHEHVSMSSSRWPLNGEGFYALRNRTGWPMGAGTSIESIDYSFQIPLNLWRPTVEFGSSIVCRPNSTQKQVEAEQRVVLGEWLDYEMDKPAFMMREKTRYHAYGQHPYYYVSLGTEDDILSITKSDLDAFHAQAFSADRVIIAAEGDIDHAAVHDQLEQSFYLPQLEKKVFAPKSFKQGIECWERPQRGVRCCLFQPLTPAKTRAEIEQRRFISSHVTALAWGSVREQLPIYNFFGNIDTDVNTVNHVIGFTTFAKAVEPALALWNENLACVAHRGAPKELRSFKSNLRSLRDYMRHNQSNVEPYGTEQIVNTECRLGFIPNYKMRMKSALAMTNDDIKMRAQELLTAPYFLALEGATANLPPKSNLRALFDYTL